MKNQKTQIIHDTIRVALDSASTQEHKAHSVLQNIGSSLQMPGWLVAILWIFGIIAAIVITILLVAVALGLLRAGALFIINFVKTACKVLYITSSESVMYLWQHANHAIAKKYAKLKASRNSRTEAFNAEIARLEGNRQAQEEYAILEAKKAELSRLLQEKIKESTDKAHLDFTEEEINNTKIFAVNMDSLTLEEWQILYLKDPNGLSFDAFVSKNLAKIAMSQTFTGKFSPIR